MDIDSIISIVSLVLTVVIFIWSLYEKTKGDATASVSAFIAMAETTGLTGKEKMAMVVAKLYEKIPPIFKRILTQEALEFIAQWIFDYMKKYAIAYVDSHTDDPGAIHDVNKELAADLVAQLNGLGDVGLKALAEKIGLDVTGMETDQMVAAILAAFMEGKTANG